MKRYQVCQRSSCVYISLFETAHDQTRSRVITSANKCVAAEYSRLIIQSYYAAVTYIDDLIGSLLKQLAAYNVERNTAVILISDHGTFFNIPIRHFLFIRLFARLVIGRARRMGEIQ